MQKNLSTKVSSLLEVADKYKNFFFDMDGVFWCGEQGIQKAVDCVNQLQKDEKNVFFITNNSSKSRSTYVERLAKYGITTEKQNVFSASSIVADYIKSKFPEVKKCYVVGMEGIGQELEEKGIKYIHAEKVHNSCKEMTSQDFANTRVDPEIGAVIVGIDYNFNYTKLAYASLCIQEGANFFATNRDSFIMVGGRKMPGGGCCVDALARAVQQEPILTGKPNPYIVDFLCEQYGLSKEKCIMIGDNMETDIQLGINSGIDSYLVFTGVTDQQLFEKIVTEKNIIPTYNGENL